VGAVLVAAAMAVAFGVLKPAATAAPAPAEAPEKARNRRPEPAYQGA
jgi:hypothetical protein